MKIEKTQNKYPLLLAPIAKTALWGGQKLKRLAPDCPYDKIGEIWALSVRSGNDSRILNGPEAGKTLGEYLDTDAPFPLLIKFIDAAQKLSIQVHPDDAMAAEEGDLGKTEMWYILEAEEGAELIYGLAPGKTAEDFRRAAAGGEIESVVRRQPVRAGETYFIPAGLIHGIGGGILLAEIQQNSDLTYRAYDYGRIGADGKPRPLHLEKASMAVRAFDDAAIRAIRFSRGEEGLANCPFFRVEKKTAPFTGRADSFAILLVLSGSGAVDQVPLAAGNCCYLPAGMGRYDVTENLEFLLIKEALL